MSVVSHLVQELERLRVEQDVSKQFLAEQLNVSRHTIARKLSGQTELTVGEAYLLAQALGTNLQSLLDEMEHIHVAAEEPATP